MAELSPAKRHKGMRELDAPPIVTYDSTNPDTLSIALFADSEGFDFKMDAAKAERLRYLLGRALNLANEPPRHRTQRD